MTNFGMLSMSAYRNSAKNSGKHCLKSRATLEGLTRRDFGVSNRASGNVSTTNDRAAATAMTMHATGRLRVMSRHNENATSTTTERNACEAPARYSLSTCCSRPSYTSASPSTILYTYTPKLMVNISCAYPRIEQYATPTATMRAQVIQRFSW